MAGANVVSFSYSKDSPSLPPLMPQRYPLVTVGVDAKPLMARQ